MPAPKIQAARRRKLQDVALIHRAVALLERRMFLRSYELACPQTVRQYLRLQLAGETEEVFAAIFLDAQLRVIAFEPLFRGTVRTTAMHPRVVTKRALALNAAALIVAHNHPSGQSMPSEQDILSTQDLREALRIFDVQLLDHLVIGEGEPFSFAAAQLL